jgi:hypothetical protein
LPIVSNSGLHSLPGCREDHSGRARTLSLWISGADVLPQAPGMIITGANHNANLLNCSTLDKVNNPRDDFAA